VAVDVSLDNANVAEVEKLLGSLLDREGWGAVAPMGVNTPDAAPTKRQRREQPEPFYNDAGDACCPWHRKPLKDGQWGQYFSQRCTDEHANDKGYRSYSWRP
jgi:hypothetical protein